MKTKNTTRSFRLDPKQLKELKTRGIDINELVRDAVAKACKSKTCPVCGK